MPETKHPPAPLSTKRISRRRREGDDVIRDASILQRTMNRLRGYALVPKGVYRFTTHEEADAWMMKQIVANHARPKLKTS